MDREELLALIDQAAREEWTELNLRGQGLTELPPEIGQLTHLEELNLSWNQLTALPTEICQLINLTRLDLFNNQLTSLPPEIGQLTNLTILDIRENYLRAIPSEIGQLTNLIGLGLRLRDNALTAIPSEIGQLTNLTGLNLRVNQLTALPPEIGQLLNLTSLDLHNNLLTVLSPEIVQLTNLTFLNLSGNKLTALPLEISQLTNLTTLCLVNNRLTVLPSEIVQLTNLTSLNLRSNALTVLLPEIGQLIALTELSLSSNDLTALPPEIGQLPNLTTLDLSDNDLTVLPPEIGQLPNLTSLDLSGNKLTALPPEIGQLTTLTKLDLSSNELTALPPEIGQLTNLTHLALYHNHLPLPPEILEKTDEPQAIIQAWLDYLAGQTRPLHETKLVLVGEGSVGKTSLVNRLLHDTFDPYSDKTEGIAIHRWHPDPPQSPRTQGEATMSSPRLRGEEKGGRRRGEEKGGGGIQVNIWDFGGQEIMHATHQFFLTKRTLYVLVLDSRLSEAENRLDYWLTLIRSFGGDSPILIVGNKSDQHTLDLDRRGLLAQHPTVQAILDTSCKTGEGMDDLRAAIAEQVAQMPHVNDPIVTTWFAVKAELEEMDVDTIPYHRYVELCRAHNVEKPASQRVLLGFLHDLGVVLHFPDPRLETTNILNPAWVTRGVYRILNTRLPFEEQGLLTWDMLARILDDEPYQEKRMFIVDMMRKFELCYELPDRPHTYLLPDLLPKEAPATGDWADALRFEYHYPVLPGSILTRLIVRMHRHIAARCGRSPARATRCAWRAGVVLACEGNQALVRADLSSNRITLAIRGPGAGRRDLLTRIREHLDAIHVSIADLRPAAKLPVPGHPDIPPVDYAWLRKLERAGRTEFTPPGCIDPISVSQLLNGVEPPQARRERGGGTYTINVHGGQVGVIGDKADVDGGIHSK